MITNLPLTFQELFGKKVTRFKTGSELLLAYYLDKYSRALLGRPFYTDDIPIDKSLAKCRYNAFVYQKAYKRNTSLAYTDKDLTNWLANNKLNLIYDGNSALVQPIADTPTDVTYRFTRDEASLREIRTHRQTGYVDLVAFNIINGFKYGKFRTVNIDNRDCEPRDNEYTELIILRDYGNKLFEDAAFINAYGRPLIRISYMDSDKSQPDYEADIEYHRQRGTMSREYRPSEKYSVFLKMFEIGDVVLVYKRKNPHKKKLFEVLNSCSIGIIRKADAQGVVLDEIPTPETRLTQYKNITEIIAKSKCKIYTETDKTKFSLVNAKYAWQDIGVCEATYNEGIFIRTVIPDDGCEQWLTDGVNETKMWLATPDVCYAVLEDRGVKYNQFRFKQMYFRNSTPVYDVFRQRYEANKRAGLCK